MCVCKTGFSLAERGGGGTESFAVVLARELVVLAILKGGHNKFPPFKRVKGVGGGGGERENFHPVLR